MSLKNTNNMQRKPWPQRQESKKKALDHGQRSTTRTNSTKHAVANEYNDSPATKLVEYAKQLKIEKNLPNSLQAQSKRAQVALELIANSSRTLARATVAIKPCPKAVLLRDKNYRVAVASLPCYNCGIEGYSQAAHADAGKGMGIKTSDETCYPLCADREGVTGCHSAIGAGAAMSRDARREFEQAGAQWTRVKLGVTKG